MRRPAPSTSAIPICGSRRRRRWSSGFAAQWAPFVSRRRPSSPASTASSSAISRARSARRISPAARRAAEGDLRLAVYAQRNASFRGGEFFSQLDLAQIYGGTFGFENQFDVVRASFAQGGNVPRIPPVRLGGGLYWRDANWLLRANFLHAFAQRNIAQNGGLFTETPTSGYNLLKAEISYRTPIQGGREMTVGLVGNNLLNDDIRNSVSFRKNEVLLPGANLRLFANFLF